SINTIANKTGLNIEKANEIKRTSQDLKMKSVIKQRLWLDASSMNRSNFDAVPASSSIDFQIQNNDDLKNLIGAGSYCSCTHCASIFSPAAYFVDLMSFIERHIDNGSSNGTSTPFPNLKARRPDLWDLELSCENSNNMISYLDIINSALEQFIGGDVYKKLSTSVQSFHQPFDVPLEQLLQYLDYFKTDVIQRTKHTHGWGGRAARIGLGLSPQIWNVLSQSSMSDAYVLKMYGMSALKPRLQVQQFLKAIALNRNQK